jgi:hypothetical protein
VKQAEMQRDSADGAVTARIPEAYQWLLVPTQETPQSPVAWQSFRLAGQEPLAVRASRKLRGDELLILSLAGTRLRMELDRVPLWRGDHVAVKQLVEDFARYLYLPRLRQSDVLVNAVRDGLSLLTWSDSFAFADSFDEAAGRYRGLRCGQLVSLSPGDPGGLLVKPDAARRQQEAEAAPGPTISPVPPGGGGTPLPPSLPGEGAGPDTGTPRPIPACGPKRFHGSVELDSARAGRDAGRIADEVIAHLVGLVGAEVRVTLEIEAEVPSGTPEHVVRTVTENSRTLKFTTHGFENE